MFCTSTGTGATALSAVISTQVPQWLDTGTQQLVDVTSPDNVLVSGTLVSGAVASVQVGTIPYAGSDYRMEIYGRDGTLVATGEESPQLGAVTLHGAQRGNALAPLDKLPIAIPSLNTRLALAIFSFSHACDHYGQMVEYLRMSGIVPPASVGQPPANPPAK